MKKRIEKNKKSIERRKKINEQERATFEQAMELELSNRELLESVIQDITKNYF